MGLDIAGIGAMMDMGKSIIERVWPDPVKQAEEVRKLTEIAQKGDMAELNAQVQMLTGQMKINAKEAEHKNVFVSGWRPFIGWVGGFALAYQFVLYPLMVWGLLIHGKGLEAPPVLDTGMLGTLVTAMLGVGAMRSVDKKNGVTHR